MSETTSITINFTASDKFTAAHRVETKVGNEAYSDRGTTTKSSMTVSGLPLSTPVSYRITPISATGVEGTATEGSITTSDTATSVTPPDVTGLELAGQKNGTEWFGRDILLRWTATHSTATASSSGTAGDFPDDSIKGYIVRVYDGSTGAYRRTFYPPSNSFRYSYDDNYTDGVSRSLIFKVYARTSSAMSVNPASITVTNSIPAAVNIIKAIKIGIPITVFIGKSDEIDVNEYRLYASQTSGFTPNDDNEIYRGASNLVTWQPSAPGPWYFKACAVDSFGGDTWNYSAQVQNALSAAAISTSLTFVDTNGNPVGNIGSDNYRGGSVDNALAYFGTSTYADGHACKGEVNSATYAGITGANQGSGPGVKGYSTSGAGVETTNYFRAAGANGLTVVKGAFPLTFTGGILTA